MTEKTDCKIIHVKIIGGNTGDIYEIGEAMKKFTAKLPFRVEAIVTNDNVQLQDVDTLVEELRKLQKVLKNEERFK